MGKCFKRSKQMETSILKYKKLTHTKKQMQETDKPKQGEGSL